MRTLLALLLAAVPATARSDEALAKATALHAAGDPAAALAALDAAPPTTPLLRWSVPQGSNTPVVLVGRKHVVVTSHSSREGRSYPPAGPVVGPILDDGTGTYDFSTLVTAFDAVTGKRLWTRRAPGHHDIAVDDRTDAVFVWRNTLFQLNPDTGATEAEVRLKARPEHVEALLIDGKLYHPRPGTEPRRDPPRVRAYDVDGGKVGDFDPALSRLSPDERRVAEPSGYAVGGFWTSVVRAKRLGAAAADWEYSFPELSGNEPMWLGDDVLALLGNASGKAEVVRLGGADGAVRWRFVLPRGAYSPGRDQLPGNAYPDRNWNAVGRCGDHILAVGGEGTLYFLDPDTGRLKAKATPATKYLAFPRLVDGALVVCAFDGVRAIPWDVIVRRGPDEGDRVVLRARCLLALGRTDAAQDVLDGMLKWFPDRTEAWAVKADASRAADRPFDEIGARCRVLELTGRDSSPELRERWGLVKRIGTGLNTGSSLLTAGDAVFALTRGGTAFTIDTRTLHAQRSELPGPFAGSLPTTAVKVQLPEGKTFDLGSPAPPKEPAAFHSGTGYDGWVVGWRGKWFKPLDGGALRELDGDVIREHPARVKGLRRWELHVSPWGPPLGHGAGGVYDLDDNLVPVRVRVPAADARLLASNANTLAIRTHREETACVQVWARAGNVRLHEQPLTPPGPVPTGEEHLTAVGGGYLYAGRELVWLPAGPGRAWRFGFVESPGSAVPKLFYDHTGFFGRPVVRDGLLFVGCRDGAVYVFDVSAIAGR